MFKVYVGVHLLKISSKLEDFVGQTLELSWAKKFKTSLYLRDVGAEIRCKILCPIKDIYDEITAYLIKSQLCVSC